MILMSRLSQVSRSPGDPQVLSTGPSSLGSIDRLARGLGWFSLGLGLVELLAPRAITRALGMQGSEGLVRAYGVREIGSGVLALSLEQDVGLWSRVAGDGLDMLTVLDGLRPSNPKRGNVVLTLMMLAGVTALDLAAAQGVHARHHRPANWRSYRDRSGFPQGLAKARESAAKVSRDAAA